MKKLAAILIFSSIYLLLTAQEKCGTKTYEQFLSTKYPEYKEGRKMVNNQTSKWINDNVNYTKNTIITIPVVVHVIWNSNQQNISDAQIFSQIDVLNKDYRRTNIDIVNTPSVWSSIAADCEIEFCLATIDPQGSPTTGVTRTQTSQSSFSISSNDVKTTSSGGKDPWPNDDYLNIWICNLSGGLLGYATPPSNNISQWDGVVIGYRYFGTSGAAQSPYNKGRTATHEIGHWLNLDHIWGDNTCGNDQVSDTPKQEEANYSCPAFPHNPNSCGTNNSDGDMFMNYMDYTNDGCMNLFTQGQKIRMIAAINQYRSNLLNHNLCGTTQPATWDCINGNCIDPGNGAGTYSNYNTCQGICNCAPNIPPINEDFQSGTIGNSWSIINPDNDKTWEIITNIGFNSSTCIYINNADYPANEEYDDLVLPTLDFTSLSNVNLTFDYAYSLWTDPNSSQVWSDTLQIWVSDDCGISWHKIWGKSGTNLVTTSPVFNGFGWAPSSSSDWMQETINLDSYLAEDDFILKFRNVNDYENNLYIDNINISETNITVSWDCINNTCIDPGNGMGQYSSLTTCQTTCVTTNITENSKNVLIYPNPSRKIILINIDDTKEIYNLLGEKILTTNKRKIDISNLDQGIYFVKTIHKTLKFIKD